MANILSTSNSALNAAQQGLATTAHNIANAKTPGYNRQVLLQASLGGQDEGGGFIGKGTEVVSVRRVYNEYLAAQVRGAQTKQGQLESHYTQASRINNLLADPTSGLSPVLQDFFKSVQNLAANPESRGSMLAAAESMAARFQSMDGQLRELRVAVNTEIETSVSAINSYARQIADLNEAISSAQSGGGQLPNDLMDKRDYLVSQLSKETKVTISKDGLNYGVFIGNGQPMVVGSVVAQLQTIPSPTDPNEISVALSSGGGAIRLADNSLAGGKLGGLFEFRTTTLTDTQNSLGRIALGLASTFNAQHRLGMDQNAAMGGDFFALGQPVVQKNTENTGGGTVTASIANISVLQASDYKLVWNTATSDFTVTRLRDNVQVTPTVSGSSITFDGVTATLAGVPDDGDNFIVKPTIDGASAFRVLVTDVTNIAAAAPIKTSTPMTNSGSATINGGAVDSTFLPAMVAAPITMVYDAANGELNAGAPPTAGFPFPVKVTKLDGTIAVYEAGASVPYTPGATITFGAPGAPLPPPPTAPAAVTGISVVISGTPGDNDQFIVGANPTASGDNRNTVLLGALQTADTLINGTTTYQGALAAMVANVGNKTHELEVGNNAQSNLVSQLHQTQESDSGVNLDEEAANLLRYQQAYMAAGKVMTAVKEMFDVLMSMGRA